MRDVPPQHQIHTKRQFLLSSMRSAAGDDFRVGGWIRTSSSSWDPAFLQEHSRQRERRYSGRCPLPPPLIILRSQTLRFLTRLLPEGDRLDSSESVPIDGGRSVKAPPGRGRPWPSPAAYPTVPPRPCSRAPSHGPGPARGTALGLPRRRGSPSGPGCGTTRGLQPVEQELQADGHDADAHDGDEHPTRCPIGDRGT